MFAAEYAGQVNKGVPLVGEREEPDGDDRNVGAEVGADTATYVTLDDPITLTVPVQLPEPKHPSANTYV